MKLALVGGFSGTHVGGSLARAARSLGIEPQCFDTADAARGPRLLATLRWRLADRRPLRLDRFAASVVAACQQAPPDVLVATGAAPLTAAALAALRGLGVTCLNYSTDDPWNAGLGSDWHRDALRLYDVVFTPRTANMADLEALGCREVRYLPFAYDEALFAPPPPASVDGPEALFVGGADPDRLAFFRRFMRVGPPVTLAGGYWARFAETRTAAIGLQAPAALCRLTAQAKVNLCLVRRANRDGHVMRSFEIAAVGGCMLVEDTDEHRQIFGPDGECVLYFDSPEMAASGAHALIADAAERARLAQSAHRRITDGRHTYRDRLLSMLEAAGRGERRPEAAFGEVAAE